MTLLALRRRFLLDLAYPSGSPALCDLLGLPHASMDVSDSERDDALGRMRRFMEDPAIRTALGGAADDMAALLDGMEHADRRVWLISYALAVMNLLEALGVVEVLR